MADWKIVADRVALFPHPNADLLQLGKVGPFQIVCGKGIYRDGDVVVFAPERSLIPDELKGEYVNTQTGESYLRGTEKNRVCSIRLRGELSEGATLPKPWVAEKLGCTEEEIPLGVDLSQRLGIARYEPPIPQYLSGLMFSMNTDAPFRTHDVEQTRIYIGEFKPGELVRATEKVHGSQVNCLWTDGQPFVTSKGFAKKMQAITEDAGNTYWQAVRNAELFERIADLYGDVNDVQVMGEVVPVQKGFSYGFTKPSVLLFRMLFNGEEIPCEEVPSDLRELWVPTLYEGPFDIDVLSELAKGSETVSGKSLHIREGLVITPKEPRCSSEGWYLATKLLNPKYKEDPELAIS